MSPFAKSRSEKELKYAGLKAWMLSQNKYTITSLEEKVLPRSLDGAMAYFKNNGFLSDSVLIQT